MQDAGTAEGQLAEFPLARRVLLFLVLALAVSFTLWPMLRGEFVYDDLWLVAQNPSLQSFPRMWASLGSSYWDFLDERSAQFVGYWRPLTTVSLYVGNLLGHGSPVAFHSLSLALHLVATALAFELARRLLRSVSGAFCVALLFGLHPVQVEPVCWISSINDPLQGVFSLATMLAFLVWRDRGSLGLPLASAALFFCALLAKEGAVAVLPLVAAIDLGRGTGGPAGVPWMRRLLPFVRPYTTLLAAFAIYYLARVAIFGDVWAGFDRSTGRLGLTFGRELSSRVELLGGAIALLAWPRRLNLFRDTRPEIPWDDANLWIAVASIALFALGFVWAWRRRQPAILAGLWIVPAALFPAVVRIEALGRFALSERYLYMAVFGFALVLVSVVTKLAARVSLRSSGLFLLVLVALACAWRSRERTRVWQDERTLFAQSFDDNPNSPYVAWGLGRVMLDDFRRSEQIEFLKQARVAIEHSLSLGLKREDGTRDPQVLVTEEDRLQANLELGWYYFFAAMKDYDDTTLDEALAVFEKVLSFFPASHEAMTACGVVLAEQGNLAGARAKFTQALEKNPKHQEAWYELGKLEMLRNDPAAARTAFERALELKQDDPETLARYAGVLGELGSTVDAQRALDRAHELAPQNTRVLFGLGVLAAKLGEHASALSWFDRLLGLSPDFALAHLERGKVLLAMGQNQRGVSALQRACELDSADFRAPYALGTFLQSQGSSKEAIFFLERALAVDPDNPLAGEIRSQLELLRAQ